MHTLAPKPHLCSDATPKRRRHADKVGISVFALAVACSATLLGCHGKTPADRTPSLAGTWFGPMPPSRDGSVLDGVSTDGPYIPWVLVEIAPAAGNAVSGKITFCEDGKLVGTLNFAGAGLGRPPAPLTDASGKPAQSLSFFDFNQGATSVRAVLSGGEQGEAGYLQRKPRSAFDAKCHPS